MRTISKRELNQQTARVLATVEAGEAIVVTERGVPRWRIEAIGAHPDPVERLRTEGRIAPSKADPVPWPSRSDNPRDTPEDVDRIYAEMQDDR